MKLHGMDIRDRLEIEDLISRFFWCLDHESIDEAASLFTDDAQVDMGVAGRPRVLGPDGVRTVFGNRPPDRLVRHHWLNLILHSADGDLESSFQFATYVGSKAIVAAPQAVTVGEVRADFRKGDNGWLFAKMFRTTFFVV